MIQRYTGSDEPIPDGKLVNNWRRNLQELGVANVQDR